jgi:hypothetical protein
MPFENPAADMRVDPSAGFLAVDEGCGAPWKWQDEVFPTKNLPPNLRKKLPSQAVGARALVERVATDLEACRA